MSSHHTNHFSTQHILVVAALLVTLLLQHESILVAATIGSEEKNAKIADKVSLRRLRQKMVYVPDLFDMTTIQDQTTLDWYDNTSRRLAKTHNKEQSRNLLPSSFSNYRRRHRSVATQIKNNPKQNMLLEMDIFERLLQGEESMSLSMPMQPTIPTPTIVTPPTAPTPTSIVTPPSAPTVVTPPTVPTSPIVPTPTIATPPTAQTPTINVTPPSAPTIITPPTVITPPIVPPPQNIPTVVTPPSKGGEGMMSKSKTPSPGIAPSSSKGVAPSAPTSVIPSVPTTSMSSKGMSPSSKGGVETPTSPSSKGSMGGSTTPTGTSKGPMDGPTSSSVGGPTSPSSKGSMSAPTSPSSPGSTGMSMGGPTSSSKSGPTPPSSKSPDTPTTENGVSPISAPTIFEEEGSVAPTMSIGSPMSSPQSGPILPSPESPDTPTTDIGVSPTISPSIFGEEGTIAPSTSGSIRESLVLAKCGLSESNRTQAIFSLLSNITALTNLVSEGTTANQAFTWLDKQDDLIVCPNATEVVVQRYILSLFYFSLNGFEWTNCRAANAEVAGPCIGGMPWLDVSNECKWYGVECNPSNTITKLTLKANNLVGVLPDELFFLVDLVGLSLDHNMYIGGVIPESIGKLTKLTYVELDENFLGGSIPNALYTLSSLQAIDLNGNKLTGTISEDIAKLPSLAVLQIEDNLFQGALPTGLTSLSELLVLYLHGNNFTGSSLQSVCSLIDSRRKTNLGYLQFLTADCKEVECSCCDCF